MPLDVDENARRAIAVESLTVDGHDLATGTSSRRRRSRPCAETLVESMVHLSAIPSAIIPRRLGADDGVPRGLARASRGNSCDRPGGVLANHLVLVLLHRLEHGQILGRAHVPQHHTRCVAASRAWRA